MTLPASGTIKFSDIDNELSTPMATLSIGGAGARGLAGIASGQIGVSSFYSKSVAGPSNLFLAGINNYGQLADGTVAPKSSPTQTIAGGLTWSQVSVGNTFTGAVKSDGTLWMWGRSLTGELGDGTTVAKSSPVQTIAGGTNWKQVSCGSSTAAIKTDGTLWCWG